MGIINTSGTPGIAIDKEVSIGQLISASIRPDLFEQNGATYLRTGKTYHASELPDDVRGILEEVGYTTIVDTSNYPNLPSTNVPTAYPMIGSSFYFDRYFFRLVDRDFALAASSPSGTGRVGAWGWIGNGTGGLTTNTGGVTVATDGVTVSGTDLGTTTFMYPDYSIAPTTYVDNLLTSPPYGFVFTNRTFYTDGTNTTYTGIQPGEGSTIIGTSQPTPSLYSFCGLKIIQVLCDYTVYSGSGMNTPMGKMRLLRTGICLPNSSVVKFLDVIFNGYPSVGQNIQNIIAGLPTYTVSSGVYGANRNSIILSNLNTPFVSTADSRYHAVSFTNGVVSSALPAFGLVHSTDEKNNDRMFASAKGSAEIIDTGATPYRKVITVFSSGYLPTGYDATFSLSFDPILVFGKAGKNIYYSADNGDTISVTQLPYDDVPLSIKSDNKRIYITDPAGHFYTTTDLVNFTKYILVNGPSGSPTVTGSNNAIYSVFSVKDNIFYVNISGKVSVGIVSANTLYEIAGNVDTEVASGYMLTIYAYSNFGTDDSRLDLEYVASNELVYVVPAATESNPTGYKLPDAKPYLRVK